MKTLIAAVAVGFLIVGCGDGSKNESYTGVPKNGQSCEQAYKKPANVAACVRAESQH